MDILATQRKTKPSFLGGMAALIYCPDQGRAYRSCMFGAEADMGALSSDWLEIGIDMQKAIGAYERER
jgi:hypothetical protein